MADIPLPPHDEAEALARAEEVGLPVPDDCLPGVIANLALLTRHARTLLGKDG